MRPFLRCFIRVVLGLSANSLAVPLALGQEETVRQVIIRAPQDRVMAAALEHPDDRELAKVLRAWVKDGTASVVSELSCKVSPEAPMTTRSGRLFDWITQYDPDYGSETGIAVLTPTGATKVFIGSSLEAKFLSTAAYKQSPFAEAGWHAFFSPCDEKSVPWPYWWPETTKQPKVSWWQQRDFFVQEVMTSARFTPGGSSILGIMHRADHLEPEARGAETLDVIVAQLDPPEKLPDAAADNASHSPHGRCTVLGFTMDDRAALELLSSNAETHGKQLLETLLKKQAAGEARLRLFTSLAAFQEKQSIVRSARQHSYPTEMPTIPSGWNSRDMGTVLTIDPVHHEVRFELEHHPALFRRQEWRCALETPDLFMWQPQFFVQRIDTAVDFRDEGAALLGVMRTPECQQGAKGITPGETMIFMARLDGMTVTPEDHAGPATKDLAQSDVVEIEAIVFDIPASEGDAWANMPPGLADDAGFALLRDRVKKPNVKLAAHILATTKAAGQAEVSTVEEVLTVTQVDPPTEISPTRYRPTSTERIPCGTRLKVDAVVVRPEDPLSALGPIEVHVTQELEHHVSAPVEPDFDFLIPTIRDNGGVQVPEALVFKESWEGQTKLVPGKAHFIGVRQPPGDALRDRLHVAFLRARVSTGREAAGKGSSGNPFAPVNAPR